MRRALIDSPNKLGNGLATTLRRIMFQEGLEVRVMSHFIHGLGDSLCQGHILSAQVVEQV